MSVLRLKPIFETISFLFNSFDHVFNNVIPFVYQKKESQGNKFLFLTQVTFSHGVAVIELT